MFRLSFLFSIKLTHVEPRFEKKEERWSRDKEICWSFLILLSSDHFELRLKTELSRYSGPRSYVREERWPKNFGDISWLFDLAQKRWHINKWAKIWKDSKNIISHFQFYSWLRKEGWRWNYLMSVVFWLSHLLLGMDYL